MNRRLIPALALLATLVSATTQAATALVPFTANYSSSYGILRASGERMLDAREDGSWAIEHSARLLLVDVRERATFRINDGRVQSLSYQFTNPLSGNRNSSLVFDWAKGVAADAERQSQVPLRPDVFDKLSYQMQLKMDVCAAPEQFKSADYTVVDRDRLKTYRVTPVKEELLGTDLGPLRTLRLRQVRADKKDDEPTYIWLAVDWHCLLVRLDQMENGKALSLKITDAQVNGRRVEPVR